MHKGFLNFPLLRKDEGGKLLGGFSYALSSNSTQVSEREKSGKYNPNCQGGNCKAGCGAGQKDYPKWKNSRCSNNCKMNCGC